MSTSDELFNALKDENQETEERQPSELELLKERARKIGVSFSNNISVETLKARIEAKLSENQAALEEKQPTQRDEQTPTRKKLAAITRFEDIHKLSENEKRHWLTKHYMRLVRCRITCLNPAKRTLPGEIFTVANKYLGTVRKFIPYGEATANGYHIPYFIYEQLRDREFTHVVTRKDSRGREVVETRTMKEFAIEVLPPLTREELKNLAAAQAAANKHE